MSVGKLSSSVRRVVVLSRDTGFAELQDGGAPANERIVPVPNGYAAAAEILAEDTAALVIDLGALGSRHLGLLEVARKAGVEMLVVGVMPPGMTSDVFSGARLLGRSDLPAAIGHIIDGETQPQVAAEGSPEAGAGEPPEAEDTDRQGRCEAQAPTAVKLAPAKSPHRGRVEAPTDDQQKRTGMLQHEAALLTPEELSALLEDES